MNFDKSIRRYPSVRGNAANLNLHQKDTLYIKFSLYGCFLSGTLLLTLSFSCLVNVEWELAEVKLKNT